MPSDDVQPGVFVEELPSDARTITGVATSITAFLGKARRGPVDQPVRLTSFDEFERVFGGVDVSLTLGYSVRDFFANGGDQAVVVRLHRKPDAAAAADSTALTSADFIGSLESKTGLYALEDVDLFNLLCVTADARGGDVPDEVYGAALDYCVQRRAVLIVDPKAAWSNPATARAGLVTMGLSGDRGRNGAMYFPRVRQVDPLMDGRIDTFAPSGMIAGVLARTDARRGVWKAPAGADASLDGASGLEVDLSDADSRLLNPLGINCLRTLPTVGEVVWGARTLRAVDAAADEYTYLQVRRTALFIEESLSRGLAWAVFEPNGATLWSRIQRSVGDFMHDLFRQGAFQGPTEQGAYWVRCDSGTMTQDDIDHGIVNVVIGFAPLRPAEFVIIRLRQSTSRIDP